MTRSSLVIVGMAGVLLAGCGVIDGLSSNEAASVDAPPQQVSCTARMPMVLQNPDFASACKSESVSSWTVSFGPNWIHYGGRPLESDHNACGTGGAYGCDDELKTLADADGCLSMWGSYATAPGSWVEVRQKVTAPSPIAGIDFSYVRAGRHLDHDWKFGAYYEALGDAHALEELTDDVDAQQIPTPATVKLDGSPQDVTIVMKLERTGTAMGHVWVTVDDLKLDLCLE